MQLNLKPSHAKVREYFAALNQFGQLNISHESAVRQAFAELLDSCARQLQWKLVHEVRIPLPNNKSIIVDGAVLDAFTLRQGYWEAKDLKDDLDKEVKKKLDRGYPKNNIIFQSPNRAILYQGGLRRGLNEDITDAANLVELLKQFFSYREPQHEEWEAAVAEFSSRIPEIAGAVKEIIEKEKRKNQKFVAAFEAFVLLCRQAINPNLSEEAVEKMLIQHLLTERIFRKVFDNPEFTRRNIIAAEIEKVIDSLTSKHFSRDAFLKDLDRFYRAIEVNAENATDYSEKQSFLNTVYERFFQGFSPKEADTHGIVYTPQPIVNFIVRSVEEILKKEFNKSLSDRDVHILDPFVGTGNFIVRVIKEIKKTALPYKYASELHCNEVMLLPYYIASMNIEHAYLEATGEYKPFEGICLVDTFELAEASQASLFTAENTARVENQKKSPIFVVIGNPPYNAWQANENDNNRNRKYPVLDNRVANTFTKASIATNKNALSDPYVKAFRWASDRVGEEGIVAFVSNNAFIQSSAFDGMRMHLRQDFSKIYHLNLKGNAHTTGEERRRQAGNVFDDAIRVGIGITLLVRRRAERGDVRVYDVDDYLESEDKKRLLDSFTDSRSVPWHTRQISGGAIWDTGSEEMQETIGLIPIGLDQIRTRGETQGAIFEDFSRGFETTRDAWVYNFQRDELERRMSSFIEFYNIEIVRWKHSDGKKPFEEFISSDEKRIKWCSTLKQTGKRGISAAFNPEHITEAMYRPFVKEFLYTDPVVIHRPGVLLRAFPPSPKTHDNRAIWHKVGLNWPFFALCTNCISDLLPQSGSQFFAFYLYDENASNRRENISDWSLEQFRSHYKDKSITKWDIFHYTYAVLHHPEYRTVYAANLKRELPRVPYAPDFHGFAKIGEYLAELHVDYEKQKEYPLERKEKAGEKLDFRVEKMRLSKDKATLTYNNFLTLSGIPKETYDYRLGNRSALEWVIDQYQVSTDRRSGITNDPNRDDDPEYILRLIGQVITVSLETVMVVNALPDLGLPKEQKQSKAAEVSN